jgi:peroxiredoxin
VPGTIFFIEFKDKKDYNYYIHYNELTQEMSMKKHVLSITLIAIVLVASAVAFAAIEKPAPDFALTDIDGNTISLADLKGKVVFLNFWATWCGPCRHEIPDFIEFYDEYKDRGMEIIGISVDKSARKVKDFMGKHKINYPVAMATNDIMGDYKPGRYIPTTIIINAKGHIVEKKVGIMSKAVLEGYFQEFSK